MKKPGHPQHKHLRFVIVHEQALNVATKSFSPNLWATTYRTTTWNRLSKPFSWSITRPETGEETFTRSCPYCGGTIEISVASLASMASQRKRGRRVGVAGMIAAPVLVAVFIAGHLFLEPLAWWVPVTLRCFFGFGLVASVLAAAVGFDEGPGYFRGSEFARAPLPGEGPFNGHYIQTVESH